jgi:hypothetical protein
MSVQDYFYSDSSQLFKQYQDPMPCNWDFAESFFNYITGKCSFTIGLYTKIWRELHYFDVETIVSTEKCITEFEINGKIRTIKRPENARKDYERHKIISCVRNYEYTKEIITEE